MAGRAAMPPPRAPARKLAAVVVTLAARVTVRLAARVFIRLAARASEQPVLPIAKIVEIVPAQHLIADLRGAVAQPPLESGAALGRIERLRLDFAGKNHLGHGLCRRQHGLERAGAAGAGEVVGVLPLGQEGEAQAAARSDQRQRGLHGAKRGLRPARSPSKHRIGSSAIFHNSSHWSGVSAVPSRATALAMPTIAQRDHVHIAFDRDHRSARVRRLARDVQVVKV